MRQIVPRLLALWERLDRENRRLLALLRAGHSLVDAEEALASEPLADQQQRGSKGRSPERRGRRGAGGDRT